MHPYLEIGLKHSPETRRSSLCSGWGPFVEVGSVWLVNRSVFWRLDWKLQYPIATFGKGKSCSVSVKWYHCPMQTLQHHHRRHCVSRWMSCIPLETIVNHNYEISYVNIDMIMYDEIYLINAMLKYVCNEFRGWTHIFYIHMSALGSQWKYVWCLEIISVHKV